MPLFSLKHLNYQTYESFDFAGFGGSVGFTGSGGFAGTEDSFGRDGTTPDSFGRGGNGLGFCKRGGFCGFSGANRNISSFSSFSDLRGDNRFVAETTEMLSKTYSKS